MNCKHLLWLQVGARVSCCSKSTGRLWTLGIKPTFSSGYDVYRSSQCSTRWGFLNPEHIFAANSLGWKPKKWHLFQLVVEYKFSLHFPSSCRRVVNNIKYRLYFCSLGVKVMVILWNKYECSLFTTLWWYDLAERNSSISMDQHRSTPEKYSQVLLFLVVKSEKYFFKSMRSHWTDGCTSLNTDGKLGTWV